MTDETLHIRLARLDDKATIIDLIDDAAGWLRTKGTDQWNKPWPSREARDERVERGLRHGSTRIVEDSAGLAVATVTFRKYANPKLWSPPARQEMAVYVCRLVVRRSHAGSGVGAALIDWAGLRGLRGWGARWIRIDVWTTNVALHNYYEKRGFRASGYAWLPNGEFYPSAALFQKPTSEIDDNAAKRFLEAP